jgi:protein-S-isoprenylcysteine O-methyltransferase Ste14
VSALAFLSDVAMGKLVWVLAGLAWCLVRLPYEVQGRRTRVRTRRKTWGDFVARWSAVVGLGFVPALYVYFDVLSFADYRQPAGFAAAGTAVVLLAILVLYRTHRDLGRQWSYTLEVRADHRLVTTGIYARCRHPMYLAFFLWGVAQALLLPNLLAGAAGLVGAAILFIMRHPKEERLLLDEFGEAYAEYLERTRRLIPRLF